MSTRTGNGPPHCVVLLTVVKRSRNDIESIEDYVQRETAGEGVDPTAPRQAGA